MFARKRINISVFSPNARPGGGSLGKNFLPPIGTVPYDKLESLWFIFLLKIEAKCPQNQQGFLWWAVTRIDHQKTLTKCPAWVRILLGYSPYSGHFWGLYRSCWVNSPPPRSFSLPLPFFLEISVLSTIRRCAAPPRPKTKKTIKNSNFEIHARKKGRGGQTKRLEGGGN